MWRCNNVPPGLAELRRREPLVRAGPLLRMAETKRLLHIADYREYVASHSADSDAAAFSKLIGVRTTLEVPMLKEDDVVGAIVIYRKSVRRFDDREIALIKDFAAQAVIAIENARLLNELRQRTDDLGQRTTDLTEALEQQTATSEVLQVISRSPGDLKRVFASLLENAVRICGAKFGIMNFPEPGGARPVAMHNVPEAFAELRRRDPVVHFGPKHPLARAAVTKQVVHIPDLELYAGMDGGDVVAKFRELTGARTILHAPMLKDEELLGIVSIYRQEVRPFTDKQIDLVKSFAAQAVIAIENARLLNELRQRTTDLSPPTLPRRWSSRRLPLTCSRLSLALLAILSQFSKPCWKRPSATVMPSSAPSFFVRETNFLSWPRTTCRPRFPMRIAVDLGSCPVVPLTRL